MASLAAPRSHLLSPVAGLLLLVITIVISFTSVADSARVSSAPTPTTTGAKPPIEVYPGCSKTHMPKRCSFRLSNLAKSLAETKATIAGPDLAATKLKSDSCITECAKTVDEATAKATAAEADVEALKALKGYLYDTAINNYGPIGPCECNCPEPCTAEEAAAVKKLGEATGSMRDLGDQLKGILDDEADWDSEGKKAEVAAMEKSIDSGLLHVTCGLTKEPQRCIDELSALDKTTTAAKTDVLYLQKSIVKPPLALDLVVEACTGAIDDVNLEIYSAEHQVKNLTELRATIRSFVHKVDDKEKPLCKYPCPAPPPPEKPCTATETAIVDKMRGVYDAWVAADKFITELLPPAAEAVHGKEEAPKKTDKY